MSTRVLVADRDKVFIKGLKYSLEQDDYSVDIAYTVKETLEKIKKYNYDLLLLSLFLPDGNGFTLCQSIRKKSQVPIIVLLEKRVDINKVLALENGADDYMVKPFNTLVLKAKMKAILRRINMHNHNIDNQVIKIDDFIVNTLGRRLIIGDKDIILTGKEFDLFYILASNPGGYLLGGITGDHLGI